MWTEEEIIFLVVLTFFILLYLKLGLTLTFL